MPYSLAKALRPDKLVIVVNQMMTDGWQPIGSPREDLVGGVWIQAMVRAEQKNGDVQLREPKKR